MGFHISPCTGTNTASFISHQEKGRLSAPTKSSGAKRGVGRWAWGCDLAWGAWYGDMAELEEEEGRSAPEFPLLHISYLPVLQSSLLLLHWGEEMCLLRPRAAGTSVGWHRIRPL